MLVLSLRRSGKPSHENMHLNSCSLRGPPRFFFFPDSHYGRGQRATHRSHLHFPTDQTGRGPEICASDHAAAVARQRDYVHSLAAWQPALPIPYTRSQVPLTAILELSKEGVEFQGNLCTFMDKHLPHQ